MEVGAGRSPGRCRDVLSWPVSPPRLLCVQTSCYKDTSHWEGGPPRDLNLTDDLGSDLVSN